MNSDKLFWFCIGGLMSIITVLILQYSRQLESRNAYQQGVVESQRQWLEYEKGERWP